MFVSNTMFSQTGPKGYLANNSVRDYWSLRNNMCSILPYRNSVFRIL